MPEERNIQELKKFIANLIDNNEEQVFTEFCHFRRLFFLPFLLVAQKEW